MDTLYDEVIEKLHTSTSTVVDMIDNIVQGKYGTGKIIPMEKINTFINKFNKNIFNVTIKDKMLRVTIKYDDAVYSMYKFGPALEIKKIE